MAGMQQQAEHWNDNITEEERQWLIEHYWTGETVPLIDFISKLEHDLMEKGLVTAVDRTPLWSAIKFNRHLLTLTPLGEYLVREYNLLSLLVYGINNEPPEHVDALLADIPAGELPELISSRDDVVRLLANRQMEELIKKYENKGG